MIQMHLMEIGNHGFFSQSFLVSTDEAYGGAARRAIADWKI
jgi:hypothetical protein